MADVLKTMTRALRRMLSARNGGLLIALALGALSVQPYFFGRLVNGSDTYYHIHRLWQVHTLLDQGVLFSRWVPDLAYGFGFPLFNAHGPLPYYASDLFVRLSGSLAGGYLTSLIGYALLTAFGAWLWLREVAGERAALVGVAAFIFAPYLVSNIQIRGTIAEPLGFAMLPFVLWAIARLARDDARPLPTGALAYAALALNHNATLLLFTPCALLYGAALAAAQAGTPGMRARRIARILAMLALGIGLAAFYVLPAFLERGELALARLFAAPELDYRNNFVGLAQLLSNPPAHDARLTGAPYPQYLGLFQVLFGALSLGWLFTRERALRAQTLAGLLIAAACVFMMLPQSVALWDALPILRVLQFARRFLPVASLFAALPAALGAGWLLRAARAGWQRNACLAALIALPVLGAFPLQNNDGLLPMDYQPTAESIMRLEAQNRMIATTVAGEYIPVTVAEIPPIALSPILRGGARLDPASFQDAGVLLAARYGLYDYDARFELHAPARVVFTTFAYPGWRATVDGAPAPITPSTPYGFIQIDVPAGAHQVLVWFGETPLRIASDGVSLLAALGLMILVLKRPASISGQTPAPVHARIDNRAMPGLLLCVGALFAFKSLVVDRRETVFNHTRFDGHAVAGLSHPAQVNFGKSLIYLGAQLPAQVASGDALQATLYWRPDGALARDFSVSAQVVDARGVLVGQSDHQHPADVPTRAWPAANYARDTHVVRIAPGTPPGAYMLRIAAYPYGAPDTPLPVMNDSGSAQGMSHDAGSIVVTAPGRAPDDAALAPAHRAALRGLDGVTLIGYDFNTTEAQTGDALPVTLYARLGSQARQEQGMALVLRGGNGSESVVAYPDWVPEYPLAQWRINDAWRAHRTLFVPATLSSGDYQVLARAGGNEVALGSIKVRAPEHVMIAPNSMVKQQAQFGAVAALSGYDMAASVRAGSPLTLTLVWRSTAETPRGYKVFTHMLDASGRLVASDDSVPARWTRPTRGWMPGEYIVDAHTLQTPADLPAGLYTLQVGFYDELNGERPGEPMALTTQLAVGAP